jgi:Phospholipase B
MRVQRLSAYSVLSCLVCMATAAAQERPTYQPDPASVERYGPAYRYPQAGWIVLHIEGQPYERGYQHGRLLAPEILDFLKASANMANHKTPAEGWHYIRTLVNALFLRQYEQEYLEEMKGIAEGANAAGVRWEGRPIDLLDVVALNAWAEVETLDPALDALPTGLEGKRFPGQQPKTMPAPKPMHCSAFAANGPATRDGKIVFGHITMFGLYASRHFNVWLDVKPAKGHRVLMQTYPAGIQSGMDYYMNDVGLLVTETTIGQTRFDINGQALASRIRQALQYGSSIDEAVAILSKANNGLYTNEWLLADVKTNEIAMFELGTHKTKLYRSSKNEWFGDTPGFYWGCNNTKDREVRLETIASVSDRPANLIYRPGDRDQKWVELYQANKGKMDAEFGKLAFTTPPLAAYHSLDAKFTTSDMAKRLENWALFGPPLGRSWQPRPEERERYPDIKPLVSNPWTILHSQAPSGTTAEIAEDMPQVKKNDYRSLAELHQDPKPEETRAAWRGTLFPKSDGDIWLATAFAEYERVVASEIARREGREKAGLAAEPLADADFMAEKLYPYRSMYLAAAVTEGPVPLQSIRRRFADNRWYGQAMGKGVLCLHALREHLGLPEFLRVMDSFGMAHAGKEVTKAEFRAHVEKESGKSLEDFFRFWLEEKPVPFLRLASARAFSESSGESTILGELTLRNVDPLSMTLQAFVQTEKGEELVPIAMEKGSSNFALHTKSRPHSLRLSPSDTILFQDTGVYTVTSFMSDLEHTLIVYGTLDEAASNLEAAQKLQRAIIEQHSNLTVPYKSDKDVTDGELRTHHVLLIGRPDSNRLVGRLKPTLPVTFGPRSFKVGETLYAHPGSAVLMATMNLYNPRFSTVIVAGLAAESTLDAAPALVYQGGDTQIRILPNRASARGVVLQPADYKRDLRTGGDKVGREAGAGPQEK